MFKSLIKKIIIETLQEELRKGIKVGNQTAFLTDTYLHISGLTPKVRLEGTGAGGADLSLKEDSGYIVVYDETAMAVTPTGLRAGGSLGTSTELTISAGSVTATRRYHTIDTEAGAGTDDLVTINYTGFAGDILLIAAANSARTVVVKHGTGNIRLNAGADFNLDNTLDTLILFYDGINWVEIARSSD